MNYHLQKSEKIELIFIIKYVEIQDITKNHLFCFDLSKITRFFFLSNFSLTLILNFERKQSCNSILDSFN